MKKILLIAILFIVQFGFSQKAGIKPTIKKLRNDIFFLESRFIIG